ncbi:radical SAM protein [Streptomyces stelliscabiei]|uniref:radical SAM protein n=1 Tax=Streptomyces stelliscabiei TaxID=146820 RepID=UPI0029A25F84|nr:radical SAM protein [Streptomyces stelliscabiei]MDX2557255.1 radical SAM protein [Streptomyces stelliscabiei]MDX2616355.1 radical SAM protein [Streptomyces stelliscabiei]MDX2641056.1 radical SAM protein [Streptomyces stelliscabiei]MDX2665118.1 radical SAM protein [Streptomyces stelliscabiei]MDX2716207.1 radical SAM protein [Streptomyces stelliscabiei]
MTIAPQAPATLRFLSLEITDRCQFTCPTLCYAKSGPTGSHGDMTEDDWNRTIDEAVALGAEDIQLIGGEPTVHPAFARMVRRAVGAGLRMRVYSNLFRIREEHWKLFEHPDVRLATTYHSTVAAEHDKITGRAGSHKATRANIVEAVRRGIRLKVAVLDAGDHERAERARAKCSPSASTTYTSARCRRSATRRAARCPRRRRCAGGAGTRRRPSSRTGACRCARWGGF